MRIAKEIIQNCDDVDVSFLVRNESVRSLSKRSMMSPDISLKKSNTIVRMSSVAARLLKKQKEILKQTDNEFNSESQLRSENEISDVNMK